VWGRGGSEKGLQLEMECLRTRLMSVDSNLDGVSWKEGLEDLTLEIPIHQCGKKPSMSEIQKGEKLVVGASHRGTGDVVSLCLV